MSFNPILGILAGLAQGANQAKQASEQRQDRNMLMQQNQNQLALQKLQMQRQQFDLQQSQRQAGIQDINTTLSQLKPEQLQQPKYTDLLLAKFRKYGIDPPPAEDGPNGTKIYNWAQFTAQPMPDISQISPQERDSILAWPPNSPQRKAKVDAYGGSPEQKQQLMGEAQVLPALNSAQADTIRRNMDSLQENVSKGVVPYKNFVQQIKNMGPSNAAFVSNGGEPPMYNYNELVDPKSAYSQGLIGQAEQAKIDRLKRLGFQFDDEMKYKNRALVEKTREFGLGEARKSRHDQIMEQATQQRINIAQNAASMAERRLAVYEKNGQISLNKWQYQQELEGNYGLKQTTSLMKQQLDFLNSQARNYIAAGKEVPDDIVRELDPNYTDPDTGQAVPTLASKYEDLVTKQAAALQAIGTAQDNSLSATTGHKVQVVPGQDAPSKNNSGGAVGLPAGWRTVSKNADGTFEVSDGKTTRTWRN
jgi:hypothetical protein